MAPLFLLPAGESRVLLGPIGVHIFTASGIVCAFFAALAMIDHAHERMFVWLGLAFVIDAVDGTMARHVRVLERLPRFSGERLDLVIDYVTYVFIPALALVHGRHLQGGTGLLLSAAILMSSLYHFADEDSKAPDHSFVGFPAVWNIVAFYVFAFDTSTLVTSVMVVAGVVMTFVPWRWVHPMRVVALRGLTLAACVVWTVAALWVVIRGFPAQGLTAAALLAVALYAIGLALVRRGVAGDR